MDTIKITLEQLESLLREQKRLTAHKLLGSTASFNPESTEGTLKSMNIDKDKFITIALTTQFPDDIQILKKYL